MGLGLKLRHETKISTGVYKYNYHIKFTVPAANVISIN